MLVSDPPKEKQKKLNTNYKKLTLQELNNFGYQLTGKKLPLGRKPIKYAVLEVKNEDDNKCVGFCFTYSFADKLGFILPNTFEYFVKNPEKLFI